MRETKKLERRIADVLCQEIRVEQRGLDRYQISSPFSFADGDTLPVVAQKSEDGTWEISDEGRTFLYLSYYDVDMENETRQEVLSNILKSHFMMNTDDGVLVMPNISESDFPHAIYTFIQSILKVSDFDLWKREIARTLFMDEFRSFISNEVVVRIRDIIKPIAPDTPIVFNYYDKEKDPQKIYPVDCSMLSWDDRRVNIFGVHNDMKAKNSVITMMHYERLSAKITNYVLFESEESLGKKTLIQVNDVADKTFSTLEVAKDRFVPLMEKNFAKKEGA